MSTVNASILIAGPGVTRESNRDVQAVKALLERRRASVALFDTAQLDRDPRVALSLGDAKQDRGAIDGAPLDGYAAIWRSGPLVFVGPPRSTPEQTRTIAASWETAFAGALELYEGFVLDRHLVTVRAENKPYQLHLAKQVGLEMPRTLITNDPEAVRAFAREGAIVLKLLVPQGLLRAEDAKAESRVMWTQELGERELANLSGLRACPMIFQERIRKARDIRVTFVGDRLFPASVDPNIVEHPHVDWRHDGAALQGRWERYTLPRELGDKLQALRIRLGLNYGAFDLIEATDGRHLFLEVNAFASFSFLGPDLATPVAEAIAEILLSPPPSTPHG